MTADPADLDVARLSEWLHEQTGQPAELTVTPIRGGGSCEMFRIDRLGRAWVLRRAPATAVSDTAHQVIREARIMQTLAVEGVPVPKVLAYSEDTAVLGAPFFVMSYVDGHVVRHDGLPQMFVRDPGSHAAIGEALIDTLITLHQVDWRTTVLSEMSRPEGFLERQVDRWMTQLDGYRTRELPGVDDVARWLDENLPARGELTVMHGDYKIDNVIWAPSTPPRIACVVDFEMTTVGDPLIDLAWAMTFWPEPGNPIALASPDGANGIDRDQCQPPQRLVDRYVAGTGRDVEHFIWYQAFSAWKLAIVLEASYAKYQSGQSRNPVHQFFGPVVDLLLIRARRFLE